MDSMKGKTVVITGPTSGIGKEIAVGLASQGAELVLGCRDLEGGRRTADEIARRTGTDQCVVLSLDASSRQSIREFAREVQKRHRGLDVLVNNAAVSRGAQPWAKSVDGIELSFATNVLGYFLLTRDLLGRLKENSPTRIVNVASTFASDLDLDDLQFERRPFEGMKAYAQSKACDRLLTWAFARRLEGTGVTANAMAPGLVVETGLYRYTSPEIMARLRQRSGRTAAEGADTAAWLASSAEVQGVSGKFFENRKEIPCSFRDETTEERLWSICESLAG